MDTSFAHLYLENQLCFPLYAASRLTTKIYAPHLTALDLTYTQYLVLLVLWQHQTQTVNEIGEKLILESNTLTPLLKRMEQKELIIRKRSSNDERQVIIKLTDKGEQLQTLASEIPKKLIASFDNGQISEQELLNFQQTLHKLIALMNR
jgi:MarR family transcriptional regulator, organic hydroperoxide resistance regulator